jgi:hypothetical protein
MAFEKGWKIPWPASCQNLNGSRPAALRSQVPLTALMVVYTFLSLSILSEPIVERRPAAQPTMTQAVIAIPEDAGSRARDRPAAAGRDRPLRTFEIDLPRARFRLSRRH